MNIILDKKLYTRSLPFMLFYLPAFATSFLVQCPSSTPLHPLVNPSGIAGQADSTQPNPNIKCQEISGGDGFASMGDGHQIYCVSAMEGVQIMIRNIFLAGACSFLLVVGALAAPGVVQDKTQEVTVSNFGKQPLAIKHIEFSGKNPGDFSQKNNCGKSLDAGKSCTVYVVFTPKGAGSRNATMTVVTSEGKQIVKLARSGIAKPSQAESSPPELSPAKPTLLMLIFIELFGKTLQTVNLARRY